MPANNDSTAKRSHLQDPSSSEGVTPIGRPDWLSPPSSPQPGANPFFDETEHKRSQMLDSKYFATQPQDSVNVQSSQAVMPDFNTLLASPSSQAHASLPPGSGISSSGTSAISSGRLRTTSLGLPSSPIKSRAPTTGMSSDISTVDVSAATGIVNSSAGNETPDRTDPSNGRGRSSLSPETTRRVRPSSNGNSPSRAAMPSGVPNFQYKEHPPYSTAITNADDDEEIELGLQGEGVQATDGAEAVSAELQQLYAAFQTCIDLRDKYIALSCQRLEDNPINYDGEFAPRSNSTSTSTCNPQTPAYTPARTPSVSFEDTHRSPELNGNETRGLDENPQFQPWKVYPRPPKPHWESRDPYAAASTSSESVRPAENRFDFTECDIPGAHYYRYAIDSQGVYQVYENDQVERTAANAVFSIPTLKEYFLDLEYILGVISDGPAKSFAYRRIKYLESRWQLYCLLNEYQELAEMKRVPHRDFYNVRKVDTHVHHSACMNQKHLLRFIKSKMKKCQEDTVTFRDGRLLTLRQVFESLNLTAYDLSIDTLDMHAHRDAFHRFDRFNAKYNPIGESRLREIFLKTDNHIQGRYLAEVTKEVFEDLHATKYQMAEYRISIYGRSRGEWDKLAKWVVHNKLFSDNVRWLIQIPRLYEVFKASGSVQSFVEVIENIFQPLFEVTQDPSTHPEVHVFLQRVIGFDSVDDESKPERRLYRKYPFPKDWNTSQNPPYNYWLFYLFANMSSLNNWRRVRGFNTFVLRPHAGEAGDTDHLTSAFLTSHSISHGILLRKVPALCYLFYLEQIGVAMSPLSNNALFLTYERNPLPQYFKLGMNVSLSTDDPLQLHYTKEPLMEEYSVAAQIYKLSPADMCELARNSVIQSGFEMEIKRHWLGHDWYLPGAEGNVVDKTNVPNVRVAFRYNTLMEEKTMIRRHSHIYAGTKTPPLQTLQTRPDLFSGSKPSDALSSSQAGVATLAMSATAAPSLAHLRLSS